MFNPLEMINRIKKFQQEMTAKNPGMNPQEYVSQLVQSGKVSQAQFEQARQFASNFPGIKF